MGSRRSSERRYEKRTPCFLQMAPISVTGLRTPISLFLHETDHHGIGSNGSFYVLRIDQTIGAYRQPESPHNHFALASGRIDNRLVLDRTCDRSHHACVVAYRRLLVSLTQLLSSKMIHGISRFADQRSNLLSRNQPPLPPSTVCVMRLASLPKWSGECSSIFDNPRIARRRRVVIHVNRLFVHSISLVQGGASRESDLPVSSSIGMLLNYPNRAGKPTNLIRPACKRSQCYMHSQHFALSRICTHQN